MRAQAPTVPLVKKMGQQPLAHPCTKMCKYKTQGSLSAHAKASRRIARVPVLLALNVPAL